MLMMMCRNSKRKSEIVWSRR